MSGLTDAVKSYLGWHIVTLFLYLRFFVGVLIVLLPLLVHICTRGLSIFGDFATLFAFLNQYPLGKYVFSGLAGGFTPNNGFYATVMTKMLTGECEAYQPDFPWHRNPFGSMHAVCIVSLGEFTSGVAILGALQRNRRIRGIPVQIDTKFAAAAGA